MHRRFRQFNMDLTRVSVICTLIMVTGCVVHRPDYPAQWSKINRDISVKEFSGIYHDSLLSVLGYRYPTQKGANCKTFLQVDDAHDILLQEACISTTDTLFLSALEPANTRLQVKKRKGAMQLTYHPVSSAGNPLVGVGKTYVWLYKANDGSLVLRKGEYSYGLVFFLVPMAYDTYQWYQFDATSFQKVDGEKPSEK